MTTKYQLVDGYGDAIEITGDMLVGSGAHCELTVPDDQVSKNHARILSSGKGASVVDLGSGIGTFVQGERISGVRQLVDGDIVRFGSREYTFVCEAEAGSEPSATTGAAPTGEAKDQSAGQGSASLPSGRGRLDAEGRLGTIEVMPKNAYVSPHLPDFSGSDTHIMSQEDLQKLTELQKRSEEEMEHLASTIDAPTLLIMSGTDAGLAYKLTDIESSSYWTIGRGSFSQPVSITIDDSSVSETHATLLYKDDRWVIVDEESTNGTFINREAQDSATLSSGAAIRLGSIHTVFLLPGGIAAEPAESEQEPRPVSWLGRVLEKLRR